MTTPSGYQYTALTADDRRRILDDRVRAYETDLFGHQMNLAALTSTTDSEEKRVETKRATDSIDTLKRAIGAVKAERAKIQ